MVSLIPNLPVVIVIWLSAKGTEAYLSTSAIYRDWPQITTHRHGATVARYKVFS